MADINVGAISEALNNKADRDLNNTNIQERLDVKADKSSLTSVAASKANTNLDNIPSNYDYVIQAWHDGGESWYRIYKSGWVEQGGTVVGTNPYVTLYIPLRHSVYHVMLSNINEYAGERQIIVAVNERYTTGFNISNRAVSQGHFWRVCGYKA